MSPQNWLEYVTWVMSDIESLEQAEHLFSDVKNTGFQQKSDLAGHKTSLTLLVSVGN